MGNKVTMVQVLSGVVKMGHEMGEIFQPENVPFILQPVSYSIKDM